MPVIPPDPGTGAAAAPAARSGIIGNVGPFNPKEEKWENYQMRLELWMMTNKIEADLRAATLLTVVGSAVFETALSLVFPDKVNDKSYEDLVGVLNKHFVSASTPLAARLKFTSRKQRDSENMSDFIAALKRLTVDCKYTAEVKVEERLIETLCHGVRNEKITKRLLDEWTKGDLTWKKTCELSLSMELVDKDLKGYAHEASSRGTVNRVDHKKGSGQSSRGHQQQCIRCHDYKRGNGEYKVNVKVNSVNIAFTIDTAASVTITGENTYNKHLRSVKCVPSDIKLRSYGGQQIDILGEITVPVKYRSFKRNKVSLLGRNWLNEMTLDWCEIFAISGAKTKCSVDQLLGKYKDVFEEKGTGTIKGFKAEIQIQKGTKPVFLKPRPVPYAVREKVEKELDRLATSTVFEKVDRSNWASPIVVVPKADGSVLICGDYKVTVNLHIVDEPYPLPTPEDIFTKLAGKKRFTVLDLSHAYSQLEVDEKSREYLTVNTHKGLFRYRKLACGIKTAPHIFQKVIDQVLAGLPNVGSFQDDIIIGEDDNDEYLATLETVLERLAKHGIRLKRSKCRFKCPGSSILDIALMLRVSTLLKTKLMLS
ncbi:uncharacterized protein K02A2.6-like [Lineus longissimus]|uniref:uncharacterized protein K02A2.6-like n=1 Tax=Lineus longissimus TaxID=88925 RepID=UPI00315D8E36